MKNLVFCSIGLQLLVSISVSADSTLNNTGKQLIHTTTASFEQDYGPDGREEPVKLILLKGLQPGSLVSFITRSDSKGTVDVCDNADNSLFQMDIRFQNNVLHLNSQVDKEDTGINLPNPVAKCAKTTTILVYQADGYRIFINGKTVAFFKHKSDKPVNYINIAYDKIYKLYYLTTNTFTK